METEPVKGENSFLDLPIFETPRKEPPIRMTYEETIQASEQLRKTMRIQEGPLRHEVIPRFVL